MSKKNNNKKELNQAAAQARLSELKELQNAANALRKQYGYLPGNPDFIFKQHRDAENQRLINQKKEKQAAEQRWLQQQLNGQNGPMLKRLLKGKKITVAAVKELLQPKAA